MIENILKRLEQLPDFLTSTQLISLGLYPSQNAIYHSRFKKISPDYLKIGNKILYPKLSLIDFVKTHYKNGSN